MSIFTLEWFKTIFKKEKKENSIKETKSLKKPYRHAMLVNSTITVILDNGDILSKDECNEIDFQNIKEACSESELIELLSNNSEHANNEFANLKAKQNVSKNINLVLKTGEFENINDAFYFKGIHRSIPYLLIEKFVSILEKYKLEDGNLRSGWEQDVEYLSHKRFFMWCCLNPRAEVANELYRFLMQNSFRLTKQGFFVALRNVVSLENDHGTNIKIQFISNAYNKIKAVWKKNPANYEVFDDNGYVLVESNKQNHGYNNHVGNLKELYINLPNMQENRFTDDWTRTFDIRIGRIVSMPIEECNWSTQDCAAEGLHFTSNQINYVGCGDTSVLMLINPMKVVGIGAYKGRCYEYLPIMTVPREEANQILHDLNFDTIDLDEFYVENQLDNLLETAKSNFSKESMKHEFHLPSITSMEIGNIVNQLEIMKNELGKRVQTIV